MIRIVFMGTAEFAVPTLRALHANHEIAAVVSRCDACSGRGRKMSASPVKIAAEELGIPVFTPVVLSDPDFIRELAGLSADLYFVAAFRILPEAVFQIPPMGTVNLHTSLLPDYRGAAPINRAIINGDTETGLTTFFIDKKVDTGDMIMSEKVAIGPDETAGELAERMKFVGADLAIKTVECIKNGNPPRVKQPKIDARPAPKLFREDGLIDWTRDAQSIHNQVRGMNPKPGAYTPWRKGTMKIHRTQVLDTDTPGSPGLVVGASPLDGLDISCGRGVLRILEVQPSGKKCMDIAGFICGSRIKEQTYISG